MTSKHTPLSLVEIVSSVADKAELIETLKWIADHAESWKLASQLNRRLALEEIRDKARAAIARATGEE